MRYGTSFPSLSRTDIGRRPMNSSFNDTAAHTERGDEVEGSISVP